MKKALSLILALVMCLSLCACGGSNTDTSNPANDEANNPKTDSNNTTGDTTHKEELYTAVIEKLNQLVGNSKDPVSLTEEDATYLIEKLTELGDYKDSLQIMDSFSVFSNMLVSITEIAGDKMGNEIKSDIFYEYDSKGRVISTSTDQVREKFGLLAYCFPGELVFSYNEDGTVSEIIVDYFGEILARCTPQYNEWGAIDSVHILTNDSEFSANFEYDAQNRLISSQMPNSRYYSGDIREFTYAYNDVGQMIEKDMYCSGLLSRVVTTYTYEGETLISVEEIETTSRPWGATSITASHTYSYTQDGRIEKVAITYDPYDPTEQYVTKECVYNYSNLYFYKPEM